MSKWWWIGTLLAVLGVLSLGCDKGSGRDSLDKSPTTERPAVEPDRKLTAEEVRQRVCVYYGCHQEEPITQKPT